ncbi:MmgE/PrpD family protein [Pararhizobium sp. PWRC1-1]|uniref:MmgE/PrpD family protein n=1 Tax=Pararhizobium sp. PWRC1-1 TaxID=2804566 RepID=UPI003CEFE307
MQKPATTVLGNYIARETFSDLPPDVIGIANDCLLDSLGCLLGGYSLPIAGALDGFLGDVGSRGDVPIIGTNRTTDPGTAAFVQACLINALDFDDIYRKGHPGATVVAAALSVAAHVKSCGTDILEAMVVGYEVAGRVAMSLSHTHPRKTVHGHGTWQVFGAAAAAGKLLKLDARQSGHALAIAAANAPVASVMKTVYGTEPTMAKNNFGSAAQTGVNAALLAKNGFEGPLDIFEGDTGFWRMAGADACDVEWLTAGLGRVYEIREVGFKPYSCCRILQSSIQASLKAFATAGVDPKDHAHERLVITAPPIVCEPPFNNPAPADIWPAQFSAPYAVAMALLGIEPGPDWFSEEQVRGDAAMRLMARIELRPDMGKPADSHHVARAQLSLKDGRIFHAEVKIALGEAANPLPRSFLEEKFIKLARRRLGHDRSLALLKTISSIGNTANLEPLFAEACRKF